MEVGDEIVLFNQDNTGRWNFHFSKMKDYFLKHTYWADSAVVTVKIVKIERVVADNVRLEEVGG